MTTELTTKNTTGTAVALPGAENPYLAFANAVAPETIKGTLLKFSKGDWTAGNEAVPIGSTFILFVDEIISGWIKWEDSAPVEQIMQRVIESGGRVAPRKSLGDLDEAHWPRDQQGQARDPWVFTYYVPLQDPESGEWFTFTTSSAGGKSAIAKVLRTYGQQLDLHRNDNPIVEIGTGSYDHKDRSIGKVKFPIFEINDWALKPGAPVEAPSIAPTPGAIELNDAIGF